MTRCTRCLLPDTKPDLSFDAEGVCSACRAYERRPQVDWAARKAELCALLEKHRNPKAGYDCIVPVSGGKDSHYQVLTMLELGARVLAVNARTCHLTELGRKNLDNLARFCDVLEVVPDRAVRAKLNRIGLETVGDISWPEHIAIFTVPVRVSVQLGIPLLIWGENSQNEYGGPAAAQESNVLTRRWLEEFGGLLGMRVTDLVGQEGISQRHLVQYTYPTDEELARSGTTGLFLGHYVPWDGWENARIATENGFKRYTIDGLPAWVEGSVCDYENLDNAQTGVHDWFKVLKYGFGRATDIASMALRRGKPDRVECASRGEAMAVVLRQERQCPETYLGVSLDEILERIGMTRAQFDAIAARFKNPQVHGC